MMKITDVVHILKICFDANETLLMEGTHGIGKSKIAEGFAKTNNLHNETLFLSHQEVGDLIGMPRTIEIEGEFVTIWTKPIWLRRMEVAVMPRKMNLEDIVFEDEAFKDFVTSRLNEEVISAQNLT
jgi:hypothetical protein